ncbi:MAG: UDP-2,3-diacylglucosamine diphosphatase [Alphaproteobacteria bacterium]|nr:UDP-2,3-diacylglucosamine diphosphatase [Alphaproteobacteria bacterium]
MQDEENAIQCRTIWISDIHLGTRDCQADILLDFLRCYHSEKMYLVGDIIDGWSLKRSWYWPTSHSTVVQKVLRKSRKGTEVIFIPGNHDEFLRPYVGMEFGDIKLLRDDIHVTADGKRLLVMHGDEFDSVMAYAKWLMHVGDYIYMQLLKLNRWLNHIRQKMGLDYWSLSLIIKQKVKSAIAIISDFEYYLVDVAKRNNADGVVCGHIHHAEIKPIGSILYCNDGDWVESCTAMIEWFDGRLEIIKWTSNGLAKNNEAQLPLFPTTAVSDANATVE